MSFAIQDNILFRSDSYQDNFKEIIKTTDGPLFIHENMFDYGLELIFDSYLSKRDIVCRCAYGTNFIIGNKIYDLDANNKLKLEGGESMHGDYFRNYKCYGISLARISPVDIIKICDKNLVRVFNRLSSIIRVLEDIYCDHNINSFFVHANEKELFCEINLIESHDDIIKFILLYVNYVEVHPKN